MDSVTTLLSRYLSEKDQQQTEPFLFDQELVNQEIAIYPGLSIYSETQLIHKTLSQKKVSDSCHFASFEIILHPLSRTPS
jgi:hypothetical protein